MEQQISYLPEDKNNVYKIIAELRRSIDATEQNPCEPNFAWSKNLIHELVTAVTVL